MTPQTFQTTFAPYAAKAAAGTGLAPGLFLAQWAVETAYASVFAGSYNLGNITRGGASLGFVNYGSYDQFVEAEILLLHDSPYVDVLASAGKGLGDQCVALGESPWDAGHYNDGRGPGSSLIAVLPAFGLDPQTEDDMFDDTDRLIVTNTSDRVAAFVAGAKTWTDQQGQTFTFPVSLADLLAAVEKIQSAPAPDLTATNAKIDALAGLVLRIETALRGA